MIGRDAIAPPRPSPRKRGKERGRGADTLFAPPVLTAAPTRHKAPMNYFLTIFLDG